MCSAMDSKCGDFRFDLLDHVCVLQICGETDGSQSMYDYYDNLACLDPVSKASSNSGLEECEAACDSDVWCHAYTYHKDSRICTLASSCEDRHVTTKAYSGKKRGGNGFVSYIFKPETACKDAHSVHRDASLADCESSCTMARDGCVGFTYNAERRDCYLKAACNVIEEEKSDVTGIKVVQT